LLCRVWF
nr:immunoglobulin heavy chain junction region [Mus musculus]